MIIDALEKRLRKRGFCFISVRTEHREGKEGQGGREACALSGLDDDFGLGTRDTDLLIEEERAREERRR